MKGNLLFFIFLSLINLLQAQEHLNVMTFNIRFNTPGDGANAWPFRKDHAASQVLFHEAHILGVQEALHHQVQDLQQRLKGYLFAGVGRDDGKTGGEYSAIFFDTSRLTLLQTETFWLAEQTNIPGVKGWDAAITRIVTWVKLKDKITNKTFFVFNTHFDHQGKRARSESAKLLLIKVRELAESNACIVMGDFNAKPNDEPIRLIGETSNPDHLLDSKALSKQAHYGPSGTFNGFRSKESDDEPIDYIFVKNGVRVLQHATLSQTWQGRFSSDHFPVFARLVIE